MEKTPIILDTPEKLIEYLGKNNDPHDDSVGLIAFLNNDHQQMWIKRIKSIKKRKKSK